VYFNVGVHCYGLDPSPENYIWDDESQSIIPCPDANKHPQISACFIQSVDDDMGSIMRLATSEAMLFKRGSGTGTDLSTLRSSKERLSCGGTASGPVSFMAMYDRIAAIVKSGGRSRRAAKMQTLKYWHPDIWEFVECKPRMERMARDLIAAGWPKDFNGIVYSTVLYQNANLSVRVDDSFMYEAQTGGNFSTVSITTNEVIDTYPAEKLLDAIAAGSHDCGDPALQFEDTIQRWHTVPNHAPINSSNPCCFTGPTLIDTASGRLTVDEIMRRVRDGETLPHVFGFDLDTGVPVLRPIVHAWQSGLAYELVRVTTGKGIVLECTPDHPFILQNKMTVAAGSLRPDIDLLSFRLIEGDRVVSVERITSEVPTPVYDLEVEGVHNFAVTSGECVHSIVVHNSEYMHIDDSACNLASLNLLRFQIATGQVGRLAWNRDHIFNTCRVASTAMETMVGRASYPTPEIALNSHRFRPLGGGYCNLGALLMVRGLPYDSPAGRLLGAALASLITGAFYLTSADLARRFGAFEGYAANADAMMNVIEMHRQNIAQQFREYDDAYKSTDGDRITPDDRNLFDLVRGIWRNAVFMGETWGYRNSQATCIAPTGTIGYMMGCDTLGIEPETALVRYKKLAGGGVIKLVNMCVPEALRGLGYSDSQINNIVFHMERYGTIEDVVLENGNEVRSGLDSGDLPVFDCAFPPSPGEVDGYKFRPREGRSITPAGHVKMMGQATGSVSGAISKTVNMPESSTIEDIKKIYFDAWRAGCKSISVYRDGSKGDQPVTTAAPVSSRPVAAPVAAPVPVAAPGTPARFRMPDDRPAKIHKFNIMGHEGFITVGFTPDGQPGEVFIEVAKQGSTVGGLMGVIGTLISILLQHYVPMSKIVEKLAGQNFEPRGITKNIDIRFCKSIVDYVGQYLGIQFVPGFQAGKNPVRGDGSTPAASSGPDALEESLSTPMSGYAANLNGSICSACGEIMVRVGQNCEVCSCGHTSGGCGG
jgi:ribonucleotide reductase alpha subunit